MKQTTSLAKANHLYRQGHIDQALALYEDIARSSPCPTSRKSAQFNLLIAISKKKKCQTTVTEGESAISASADSPAALDIAYAQSPISPSLAPAHKELVSVIMPLYNNQDYVRRAINSCLSQEGVNLEVIIVDDGSSDKSLEVAHQAAKGAKNIRIISLLRNFGCYYARNIAVLNCSGEYVTLLDSDDIMPQNRLRAQLDAIKASNSAIASIGLCSKWSSDFSRRLSDAKHAENSLMWNRSIIKDLGLYDSVRFGGDSEFKLRLTRTFGADSLVKIDSELYFLRSVDTSLTMRAESSAFTKDETGNLKLNLSKERQLYQSNFTSWQHANKPKYTGRKDSMKISFPLRFRPFELGGSTQNASPSLTSRVVGAMASFPARIKTLKDTFESIVDQLDELIIYLNNYVEVPEFLIHPKVSVYRSQDHLGDLRDNGKFFKSSGLENSYVLTLDDDITYPSDYVSTLVHYIEALGRSCIVGCHGVIFPDSDFSSLAQRTVLAYTKETSSKFVELLGTGTTAWHSSTLKVSLDDFKTTGVCDLWFAAQAASAFVPMFCVPKKKDWLKSPGESEVSLWKEASSDSSHYFQSFKASIAKTDYKSLRQFAENGLLSRFSSISLHYFGYDPADAGSDRLIAPRINNLISTPRPQCSDESISAVLRFHIVVNGWNCSNLVGKALDSIARQQHGCYSLCVTVVDDGSTDDTLCRILDYPNLPGFNVLKIDSNSGPAFARHIGITSRSCMDEIVVLLDMDDCLREDALKIVASRYLQNQECLMTIGNWIDCNGRPNPNGFYSPQEIDIDGVRNNTVFKATHLRTFRRKLYSRIAECDLMDDQQNWLQACTDVALMYALLDQCRSANVEFIEDHIYIYNRSLNGLSGTL